VEAALDVVRAGGGLARLLSYQIAPYERDGSLRTVLTAWEPPPAPIHLVHPTGRHLPHKTRMFLDLAGPALRAAFGREGEVDL
jgi:DNA-binding transcriptional LysR family regulator